MKKSFVVGSLVLSSAFLLTGAASAPNSLDIREYTCPEYLRIQPDFGRVDQFVPYVPHARFERVFIEWDDNPAASQIRPHFPHHMEKNSISCMYEGGRVLYRRGPGSLGWKCKKLGERSVRCGLSGRGGAPHTG